MANLTLTIDDVVLRKARIRAVEQGTSVNAVVRAYLEAYADGGRSRAAARRVVALARAVESGSGPEGRTWRRDDVHER